MSLTRRTSQGEDPGSGGRGGRAYRCRVLSPTQLRGRLFSIAPVGGGVVLVGLASYAVLGLAGHSLPPRDYAAVASLYLLTTIAGPGIFIAIEQETSREVSSRLATSRGTMPVVRSASVLAATLAMAVMLGLLALSPVLVHRAFGGYWVLLVAALVAVAGSAVVSVLRGMFAGQRRFGWYASALAAEGVGRIVLCAAVLVVGASVGGFGFAFALGAVLAALVTIGATRPGAAGPAVSLARMGAGAGFLVFASGLTFLVANLAPVVVTSRLTDEPAIAASFVSVFVIARIPLLLFAPIQVFLLPSLAAAIGRGDPTDVRAPVRAVVVTVAAIGLPGVFVAALLGPWAARVFFAAPIDLPGLAVGLLGLSSVAMMVAQTLQPALIALGSHRMVSTAWTAGALAFLALLFAPIDPLSTALAGQLAGPAIVVAIMALALRTAPERAADRAALADKVAPPAW